MNQFRPDIARSLLLSPMVIGKARAAGEAGLKWLENLDRLIDTLAEKWNLTVGSPMSGGSHACVCPAIGTSGEEYILKVEIPDTTGEEFLNSVRALQIADGHGYAKLIAFDTENRASLLERLGKPLKTLGFPPRRQMEIICDALKETWQTDVRGVSLLTGDGSIGWFRSFIPDAWDALDRPCSGRVISQAMRFVDSRAALMNPSDWTLIHGDAHNGNTLQSLYNNEAFKLIDPDGLIYEKEYDLGVLMREWPEEYVSDPIAAGRERAGFLCGLTGADPRGVWEWGFLQMTATALILLQIDQKDLGSEMLRIAEAWCG